MNTAVNDPDNDVIDNDLPIDGGEPTDEEAALAKELEEHGDDPAPKDGDGKGAAAGDGAGDGDDDGDGDGAPTPEDGAAAEAPAAAPAPAATPASTPEPEPAVDDAPVADPKPEAPKDFDAEFKTLQKQLSDGDLDEDEYQQKMRQLSRDEATYTANVAVWEDRQQRAVADQEKAFNDAALAFQAKHADFLANPLHVDSMNKALALVAQQQPGLSAVALVEEAGKVTFEAYNYTPPSDAPAPAPSDADKDKLAKATAARAPAADRVPPSVRSAPAAAELDPSRSSFSELDEADISDLEDALARLPADKVDAYLADAPGAKATGR